MNRWLREISKTTDRTTSTRPVSVDLATLLLATRSLLLITFNQMLYLSLPSDPYTIAVTMLPWFFFFGLIDIWSAMLVWKGNINGWRYGVIISVV
ncbi:MAG: hypothetical protein ACFFCP_11075, partial [Promethearchaeota archaeon]